MKGTIGIPISALYLFSPDMPPTFPPPRTGTPTGSPPPAPTQAAAQLSQATPHHDRISSRTREDYEEKPLVAHQYRWLEEDLAFTALISIEEFLQLVFAPTNRFNDSKKGELSRLVRGFSQENKKYKDARQKYLEECAKQKGIVDSETGRKLQSQDIYETQLYDPFAELCNIVIQEMGFLTDDDDIAEDNRVLFYRQDPYVIGGLTLTQRKSDLGVLGQNGRRLLDEFKGDTDRLAKNMMWHVLAHWIEMKRLNGNTLLSNSKQVAFSATPKDETVPQQSQAGTSASADSNGKSTMVSTASSGRKRPRELEGTGKATGRKKAKTQRPAATVVNSETPSGAKLDAVARKRKQTNDAHDLQLQNAGYALEMLSSGCLRSHVIGMAVDTKSVQFSYYDHSGILLSAPFSIEDNEQLFLSILYHFRGLNAKQRGFVPRPQLHSPPQLEEPCKRPDGTSFIPIYHDAVIQLGEYHELRLGEHLYTARSIIGRGTLVMAARGDHSSTFEYVVKISFPVKNRTSESRLLWKAVKVAKSKTEWQWVEKLLPKMRYWDDTDLSEANGFPHQRIKAFWDARLGEQEDLSSFYEERILRVICEEMLHPLTSLREVSEYAQVFCDILQGHRWLYDRAQILHRDISMQNIMVRRVPNEGKVYGVLNDLDLSSEYLTQKGPSCSDRTGTRPYMARVLLSKSLKGPHLYRYDLESAFYVMLCYFCRYNLQGELCTKEYDKWYTGNATDVLDSKTSLFSPAVTVGYGQAFKFNPPVTPDFLPFVPILVELYERFLVADATRIMTGLRGELFEEQTANNTITYGNFLTALQKFGDGKVVQVYYPDSDTVPLGTLEVIPDPSDDFESMMGRWLDDVDYSQTSPGIEEESKTEDNDEQEGA
ncbi:hypothetical protein D9758_009155 [Tetrapyrgos nigripes]|uniref:Protein kinase domain-containing protein n=1 Tax=Tetrapyrgos nigripes TaxID=182062 RepID=A0A8H5LKB7_9AGAR|nr:hypothetical protein D9758_009155 [Tetrapyrgos nigripes]